MPVTYVDKIYYNNSQYSRGYKGSELLWDKKPDFFYIENLYNGLNTVTLKKTGSPTTGSDIQWSGDLVTWTPVTYDANNEFLIGIPNQSQKIYFRSSTGFTYDGSNYFTFTATENHRAGGDARTLIDYSDSSLNTAYSACLRNLFQNDTKLTDASNLDFSKITTLASACYASAFYGCSSLTQAPTLPATNLAIWCYKWMFQDCTSLTQAPALPATNLYEHCYYNMFRGCTSLVNAPALPATTLVGSCYYAMFSGCTSLTKAPALPATTLATECYRLMFNGCTSLTKAPDELPATTSAESCYRAMFQNCSALEYSPDIYCSPDSTTAFNYMFYGCSILHEIKIHSTTWDTNNTTSFTANVASFGTFYNFGGATIPTGTSGIPSSWVALDKEYFYIENRASGSNTITLTIPANNDPGASIAYSINGTLWYYLSYTSNKFTKTLTAEGDRVYFRSSDHFSLNAAKFYTFSATGNHAAGGDLRTLINYTDSSLNTALGCDFLKMFQNDTYLVDITNLDFSKITVLAEYTYSQMFYGCTSLTTTPDILPAADLVSSCYANMFTNCSSITTAPVLPARLVNQINCYWGMFSGCTSLNRIEVHATTWDQRYTKYFTDNVSVLGDFYNLGGAYIPTGIDGIPSGWTEHTTL